MIYAAYYNPELKSWRYDEIIYFELSRPDKKPEIYFEVRNWKDGFVYYHPEDPVLITNRRLDAVYSAGRQAENKTGGVVAYMHRKDCEWQAHMEELAGRRLL